MKAYSLDFRQKIVQTDENEKISQAKLAKRFNVAKRFVQTWLKQWRETGDLNPKPQGGHKKLKVSPPQLIIIGDWIEEKNDLTLQAIQQRLENTKVSISTVWRVLHHLNLTLKKKLHASERYTERVQQSRLAYRESVRDIKAEDMVFIDEAGSNLGMTPLYGRSLKGTRAYGKAPVRRGENVSIIGAIALKGLLVVTELLGATQAIQFEAFIANILVPLLWSGAYVMMDNARIHQEKFIRPLIEGAGAHLIRDVAESRYECQFCIYPKVSLNLGFKNCR